MKRVISFLIVCLLGVVLLLVVNDMPLLGNEGVPGNNQVTKKYIDNSKEKVKALNVITAILVDFRGYDTLIETIVLFTASISVFTVLKRDK